MYLMSLPKMAHSLFANKVVCEPFLTALLYFAVMSQLLDYHEDLWWAVVMLEWELE